MPPRELQVRIVDNEYKSSMFTVAELRLLQESHPDAQFFIHNGYNGWFYGSPLNPTPVTLETACQLLNALARSSSEASLREKLETGEASALEYARIGDDLYAHTHGNRFLAFLPSDVCTYGDSVGNPNPRPERLAPVDIPLPESE